MVIKASKISFLSLFSQFTLRLTTECTYRCSFCNLWKKPAIAANQLVEVIKSGDFFSMFPKKKVFNIVGGDPFCLDSVGYIITYLAQQKCKVRCWTNGYFPIDLMTSSLTSISELYLYFPAFNAEDFAMITGYGSMADFEQTLDYLRGEKVNVILNHPIKVDTVSQLPDIYAFAYKHNCKLLLHYNPKDNFSAEARMAIHHFFKVKNVEVYPTIPSQDMMCEAYPGTGIQKKSYIIYNTWRESINGVYNKITL
ncbi:hypothetical protein DID75_00350 [Candidatus Marinamargulisbacteria bacterium SCGC AG-410-N11]|nr:hypothetical protein DID75_00350 [Candidatus Marinamargulisbacteria bacterium SCGC AG-410-N11]